MTSELVVDVAKALKGSSAPADAAAAAAAPTWEATWFNSRSTGPEAGLSNFTQCTLRVMQPDGTPARYPSVEAAFHSFKVFCAKNMSPEDATEYCKQLSDTKKGLEAKKLGGERHWTTKGWKLDTRKWDSASRVVMQYLLVLRATCDDEFCGLVLGAAAKGPLLHFARGLHSRCLKTGGIFVANSTAGFNASMLGPDMVDAVKLVTSLTTDEARRVALSRYNAAVWTALQAEFDEEGMKSDVGFGSVSSLAKRQEKKRPSLASFKRKQKQKRVREEPGLVSPTLASETGACVGTL